jgi:uncharacterized integral membrane protein (TIGR00697 family)
VITAKQILLPLGITITGGILVFPITYVLSDLFSEVYGYRWSRITCYIAFSMNLLMVGMFLIAIKTPAPEYWLHQEAFQTVLGFTPRILAASLAAFVIGDLVNDRVFRKMKQKHPNSHKQFGARAIVSSVCGDMTDSLIFYPLAFLGQMPLEALAIMALVEVTIKIAYEIVILPITKAIVHKVSAHEKSIAEG